MSNTTAFQLGDHVRIIIDVQIVRIRERDGALMVDYPWNDGRMQAHFLPAQLQKIEVTRTPSPTLDPSGSAPTD